MTEILTSTAVQDAPSRSAQPSSIDLRKILHSAGNHWLVGADMAHLRRRTEERASEFAAQKRVLIAEHEPVELLAALIGAHTVGCDAFLGDPRWGAAEQASAADAVAKEGDSHTEPRIMIATGGSTGNVRFAIHRWETLAAAAEGFRAFLGIERIDSVCTLSLHHVSGLMQAVRALVTGGRLVCIPSSELIEQTPNFDPRGWSLSLVPTQLARFFDRKEHLAWLRELRAIPLGGAPAWPSLLADARRHELPLSICYGMTETAAQFVALPPKDFLSGNDSVGRALPHAVVSVRTDDGHEAGVNESGSIVVNAASLALGYHPNIPIDVPFRTGDLGRIDENGRLNILGRSDDIIISGGEKIAPLEVETALRASGLVHDVVVLGISDSRWGSAVTAIYVPIEPSTTRSELKASLRERLAAFKIPKRWLALHELPRKDQGKLNREQLRLFASEASSSE
ncbi:MAG TPA: AMP-binding protein [Candidatus Baltobacteraceae bacterium]|jgi:O-succinylbenzoic acid--CoA ligase|nr:AMP-binding protein [Candidatus Baltobacteraceae bacterium]